MVCIRLNRNSYRIGFLWAALLSATHLFAQPDDALHLGAATCASSLCHGSVQTYADSPIARNEYVIWQSDRYRNMHAKAFHKLQTEAAQLIARKLGLGDASEAAECLVCHADHVPAALQGERYQLSDGVTCESCHGPAGEYIDAHVESGQSREALIEHGLYPTWDTEARGRLCLSCHLGGDGRFINHQIMGAGHPRLSFELDTFTFLQPHHVVDDDYVARKGETDFVRDWAIGQGLAALHYVDWLLDEEHGWRGIFVEPALLDCYSCHQRLDEGRWAARNNTGLGPGEMRLNDSNLVMLGMILVATDTIRANRIRNLTGELHQATTRGMEQTREAAQALQAELNEVIAGLKTHRFNRDDLHEILAELGRQSASGAFVDYVAGEQVAMAIVNLVLAFERNGALKKDQVSDDLDRLFGVVEDEYDYSDKQLTSAIQNLIGQLGT